MKRTERGFAIYTEFKDAYGESIWVSRSSMVGRPHCWIHVTPTKHEPTQEWMASAHLNVKMAKRVIKALQAFVDGKD